MPFNANFQINNLVEQSPPVVEFLSPHSFVCLCCSGLVDFKNPIFFNPLFTYSHLFIYSFFYFTLLKLSETWFLGAPASWSLCPSVSGSSFFDCFLDFCYKRLTPVSPSAFPTSDLDLAISPKNPG